MARILSIARNHGLFVIEDCAQSLGALYIGQCTGSYGDAACFSLIKNAYGIGGGVLATDNETIFQRASEILRTAKKQPRGLLAYRLLRSLVETKRKFRMVNAFYQKLMALKGRRRSYTSVKNQLRRISALEVKIFAAQIPRQKRLHARRKSIGRSYVRLLAESGAMKNTAFTLDEASFTRFYAWHPAIKSGRHINALTEKGIEAMHLEHKQGSPVQEKLLSADTDKTLPNYHKVHDCLLSLPLCESMNARQARAVADTLKELVSA